MTFQRQTVSSEYADTQADLSRRWAHMSKGSFSLGAAKIKLFLVCLFFFFFFFFFFVVVFFYSFLPNFKKKSFEMLTDMQFL